MQPEENPYRPPSAPSEGQESHWSEVRLEPLTIARGLMVLSILAYLLSFFFPTYTTYPARASLVPTVLLRWVWIGNPVFWTCLASLVLRRSWLALLLGLAALVIVGSLLVSRTTSNVLSVGYSLWIAGISLAIASSLVGWELSGSMLSHENRVATGQEKTPPGSDPVIETSRY